MNAALAVNDGAIDRIVGAPARFDNGIARLASQRRPNILLDCGVARIQLEDRLAHRLTWSAPQFTQTASFGKQEFPLLVE
jgi:hypothetical protein